jgi:hypothetical protein
VAPEIELEINNENNKTMVELVNSFFMVRNN